MHFFVAREVRPVSVRGNCLPLRTLLESLKI